MHWAKRKNLKDAWLLMIQAELPKIYLKPLVKMRVKVTLYHARLYDKDNAYGAAKVIFDSLKHHRLIVDDSLEYLEAVVEQQQVPKKQRSTVIDLEAL
jgi:Holliday junction resolvase RusA-like endonuclease